MNGKIRSTILGVLAGFTFFGYSSHANACTPKTFTDYIERANPDSKRVSPYDCAKLRISTPIVTWAHDRSVAKAYSILVSRVGGGFSKTYTAVDPRLYIPDVLPAGTYEWKVTYYRSTSTETSQARRFIIPSGTLFRIPTGAELAERVSIKGHPRTKVGNVDFSQVAQLAKNEFGLSYAAFIVQADKYLQSTIAEIPVNETEASYIQKYGTVDGKKQYSARLIQLRNIAMDQLKEIKHLGYAYHFTKDGRYLNNGLNKLQRLADWPYGPEDATSHQQQDQANREIFLALALGMDLFHEQLSMPAYSTWKSKILTSFRNRIGQVDFASFRPFPRDSHLLTVSRYAMEAMMYAVGTPGFNDQAAKDLFAKHWELWITTLGSWGENLDGGFGNGDYYGWMNAIGVIQGATTARLVANVDLTKWDLVGKTGEYLIAITPPKILIRQNFGDAYEINNNYQQYSKEVRVLAMLSGRPAYDWYWRQESTNTYYSSWMLGVDNYLVLALHGGSPIFSSGTPADLKNSYHFVEAGIVAMHKQTAAQLRTSVFFRSSSLGSFSHSHADQNSFTFNSKGQPLLINAGHYDYYGSPHHQFVTRATRFKNALTYDNGIGQAERTNDDNPDYPGVPLDSSGTYGRITRFVDNNVWAVAVGDASMAYRGFDPNVSGSYWKKYLTTAHRTVAYNRREGVVVVYDYAASGPPRQWELNFHSINLPTWQNGQTMVLSNNGATACVDVYGNNGSTRSINYRRFRHSQTDAWPTLPARYDNPLLTPGGNQDWTPYIGKVLDAGGRAKQAHVIFYDSNKTAQVTAVTVIREDCRNIPVTVDISGSWASIKINNGAAIVANGLSVTVPAQ